MLKGTKKIKRKEGIQMSLKKKKEAKEKTHIS